MENRECGKRLPDRFGSIVSVDWMTGIEAQAATSLS
jgi:hypothetical protein